MPLPAWAVSAISTAAGAVLQKAFDDTVPAQFFGTAIDAAMNGFSKSAAAKSARKHAFDSLQPLTKHRQQLAGRIKPINNLQI